MEKTYTEQEIKDWFENMMKEYQNCPMNQHLRQVYDDMFDPFWEKNNLQTFVEKKLTNKLICGIIQSFQEEQKGWVENELVASDSGRFKYV